MISLIKSSIIAALVFGGFAFAGPKYSPQKDTSKTRLIVFGSPALHSHDVQLSREAVDYFLASSPVEKPILLMGWHTAHPDFHGVDQDHHGLNLKIKERKVIIIKKAPETPEEVAKVIEAIKQAGGIFISGTSVSGLMKGFTPEMVSELRSAYKNGTTIAAVDAGANVLGTRALLPTNNDWGHIRNIPETIEGLGLLTASGASGASETIVKEQYMAHRRNAHSGFFLMEYGYFLTPFAEALRRNKALGIALDSGSSLIVKDGNKLQVLTDVHRTHNVRIFTENTKEYLNRISLPYGYFTGEPDIILDHGDKFDLNKAKLGVRMCNKVF